MTLFLLFSLLAVAALLTAARYPPQTLAVCLETLGAAGTHSELRPVRRIHPITIWDYG